MFYRFKVDGCFKWLCNSWNRFSYLSEVLNLILLALTSCTFKNDFVSLNFSLELSNDLKKLRSFVCLYSSSNKSLNLRMYITVLYIAYELEQHVFETLQSIFSDVFMIIYCNLGRVW